MGVGGGVPFTQTSRTFRTHKTHLGARSRRKRITHVAPRLRAQQSNTKIWPTLVRCARAPGVINQICREANLNDSEAEGELLDRCDDVNQSTAPFFWGAEREIKTAAPRNFHQKCAPVNVGSPREWLMKSDYLRCIKSNCVRTWPRVPSSVLYRCTRARFHSILYSNS